MLITEIPLTSLKDLVDAKVIAATKEHITVSKDGQIVVIEFGTGAVSEMKEM